VTGKWTLASGKAASHFERNDTTQAVSEKCKWQVAHKRPKSINQARNHVIHAPQWFFDEAILAAGRLNRQNFDITRKVIRPVAIARRTASCRRQAEESDAGIRARPVSGNPGCHLSCKHDLKGPGLPEPVPTVCSHFLVANVAFLVLPAF
jgi:hypothetical protein